jgi:thiol:disulfide interchange protein DsbD
MIPITFSFFTKQADARGGRVLPLALTYGAGIVLIFVLIGVFFGGIIVPFAQHPLTNLLIGLLFFLFAFALFGLVDLQPPRFLLNFAGKASTRGGVGGVFLMGATLVVTSFTCTAPFVGTLLGAASASLGHVILGMAVFGLTMAIPFVWLALAPGWIKSLPRSGEWMHTIKVFLGFLELAAALKFFSNVDLVYHAPDLWLPRELFLMLWAGIFLVAGLYLLGAFRLRDESHDGIGPGRMTAALATLLFACYCAYGALGYRLDAHVMTPIAPQFSAPLVGRAAAGGGETPAQAASHETVADDYDAAKSRAAATDRLLLINFTGVT